MGKPSRTSNANNWIKSSIRDPGSFKQGHNMDKNSYKKQEKTGAVKKNK